MADALYRNLGTYMAVAARSRANLKTALLCRSRSSQWKSLGAVGINVANSGQIVGQRVDLTGGYGSAEGAAHFVDLGKPLLLGERGLAQDHARRVAD